ncbi:hypothetical protein H5410_027877 [Solanum commersonii]|uniref:Uncharacterized protein n=1 Tax=Solanum commersonii TaxID=4109 RepID=A0A9J5Z0E6_SOLCO|nr:hypothetical protein H5410_027877 [Solanum commersonii]
MLEEEDVPGACEEERGAEVPEGPEAGVGEGASAGIESVSTSGNVSTGIALLLSGSSLVYSASMHQMTVEEDEVYLKSLASSWGTLAHQHISVIKTGNGKVVCLYLALIAISYSIRSPRSILLQDIIPPKQAALA